MHYLKQGGNKSFPKKSRSKRNIRKISATAVLSTVLAVVLLFTPMGAISYMGTGLGFKTNVAYALDIEGNISTYSETSSNSERAFNYNASYFAGTPGNGQDPEGGNFWQLSSDASNQYTWVNMPQNVSAYTDWSLTGYFKPDRITNNNSTNGGDFIGIDIYPTDANAAASKASSGGGGALGFRGTTGAYALTLDFVQNNNYGDPQPGPFGAFRWTDGNGDPAFMGNRSGLYTNSGTTSVPDLRSWSLPIKYTFKYNYNNGNPYITGGLDDRNGRTWNFSTQSTGGDALPLTVPASGYFNVALISANGNNHQNFKGSVLSFTGTDAAPEATINYLLDGTTTAVAPSTKLTSAVGSSVGIRNASAAANAGTLDYTFNSNLPAIVYVDYVSGYHAVRTFSTGNNAADLVYQKDSAKNVFNIYYAGDYQQARVITDNTDPLASQIVDTISGTTGGTMRNWIATDLTLTRVGYNYTVTAPNGSKYSTLSAAQAAVRTFDNTPNGISQSDATPQIFTVTYARSFQQAKVNTLKNGVLTTLATYNTTTTPNRPLENGMTGTLMTNVDDPALTLPGYNYIVTAPNALTYPTMQQAWAANDQWDLTPNPAGATTDTIPQTWLVTYTGHTQAANLTRTSNSILIPAVTLETDTGTSGSNIVFATTDIALAAEAPGSSYVVEVYNGAGDLVGSYATLSAALAANSKFDATENQSLLDDQAEQEFRVVYSAGTARVTYQYLDDKGNTIAQTSTNLQEIGANINNMAPTIQGYEFSEIDTSTSDSDMRVNALGTSQVTYIYVIDPDIINAANAALEAAAASPVANEASVQTAVNALERVLADDTATPQQIQAATTALNNAVASATTARNNAVASANAAISNAEASSVANNTDVVSAQQTLETLLTNAATATPGATTEAIIAATTALNQARTTAEQDRAQAVANANTAKDPANTSPVTHEPGVAAALTALNGLLADSSSTPTQINEATQALTEAVAAAKPLRDDANSAAESAKSDAGISLASSDPRVIAAVNSLQQLQDAAAADNASSSTQKIIDATTALNNMVAQVEGEQTDARSAAADAMAQSATTPVTYEPNVVTARDNLTTVLGNNSATPAQIRTSTDALIAATASAKASRDDAVEAAEAAIAKAATGTNDVTAAIADLNSVMDAAETDIATALTANILASTKALLDATDASPNDHTAVREAAAELLTKTAPVTNESDVTEAREALQALLNDTSATTEDIEAATGDLQAALDSAKADRNDAKSDAQDLINTATTEVGVSTDLNVREALEALEDAIAQADNDSSDALTADIISASNALSTAIEEARGARNDALADARAAIDGSSPVSNEPGIPALTQQLEAAIANNNTTATQLEAITAAYSTVVDAAKTSRGNANTAASNAIAAAESSDVAGEAPVTAAIAALEEVMSDAANNQAGALTVDISSATNNLKLAQQQAQADRNAAVGDANNKISQANASPVDNEQTVVEAKNALQAMLDDPATATTAGIIEATSTLDEEITDAESARNQAVTVAQQAISDANESDVSNEPTVIGATRDLQNLLNNPDATTAEIEAATGELNAAVGSAETARSEALQAAQEALAAADDYASNPVVSDAASNLEDVIADDTSTTGEINNATGVLENAVDAVSGDRDAAIATANQTLANTSPVSHENAVASAIAALTPLIGDGSTASVEEINAATETLNSAVAAAKPARETAVDAANNLAGTTSASEVGNEPSVIIAIEALQSAIELAASDSEDALTADITALTQALNEAAAAAQDVRDQAQDALNAAGNSVVENEPTVRAAEETLQNLLDDPTSTNESIAGATADLNQAVTDAAAAREEARNAAEYGIAQAEASPEGNEPMVMDAIDDLESVLARTDATTAEITTATAALANAVTDAGTARDEARAAAEQAKAAAEPQKDIVIVANALDDLQAILDSPTATVKQIEDATEALNDAVLAATISKDDAIAAATEAMRAENSTPVSNESDVVAAKAALQALLDDSDNQSAQDISMATSNLNNAIEDAMEARNDAGDGANDAIAAAASAGVSQEPSVAAAAAALEAIVAQAATDDPDALTADILEAVSDMEAATAAAKTIRDAGNQAMTDATNSGVANETDVAGAMTDLQNVLNDPASTNADIAAATDALNNAVSEASEDRDAAVAAADQAISDAGASDKAEAQSVIDAVQDLQDTLRDPTATTEDIQNATGALNDAVANAYTDRDNAIAAAKDAMKAENTSPVSNEPEVLENRGDLEELINNSASTIDQINAELAELNTAVTEAKSERAEAVESAGDLLEIINASDTGLEPEVRSATNGLTGTVASGNNDEPGGLTSLILAAIAKANAAQQTAQDTRNAAEQALATAEAAPEASEAAVAKEISDIKAVLANPESSNAAITVATAELKDALAKAQGETVYAVDNHAQVWVKGATGTLQFKIDADFSKFMHLMLGSNEVAKSNYTVVDGSTILTLNEAYLNTLAVGTHVYRAVFNDGYATFIVTVQAAAGTGGDNGDSGDNGTDGTGGDNGDNDSDNGGSDGDGLPATGDVNDTILRLCMFLLFMGLAILFAAYFVHRKNKYR